MIKLYKEIQGELHYWETWEEQQGRYTVHWGKVGDMGKTKVLSGGLFVTAEKTVQKEIKQRRSEGYGEREKLELLIIQYRLDNWGSSSNLEKRSEIVDLMNQCLGWTGLGHCDDGDIGSGTINIFCFVVNPYAALVLIKDELRQKDFLNGAVIAIEREEDFEVLYPDGFKGDFKYWYDE